MRNLITSRNAAFFAAGGFATALFLGGVAHAITDTIFKYSTPQTGFYGLSPMAFAPDGTYAAGGYSIAWPDYLGLQNGYTYGCFTTGVNLPQGAKITAFAVWYSADAKEGVQAYLFRGKVTDGTQDTIASLKSVDTSQTRKAMNIAIPSSTIAIVNNTYFVYSVVVCLVSANSRYDAGRLAFTYTNAGN